MKFLKNLLAALLGCFIALGLLFLLAVGMIGALMPAEETVTVAPSSILRIELSSAIGEQTVSDPLDLSSIAPIPMASGSSSIGILDAVRAIDYAATDPSIKFIYLTDCGYSSGISYMEELRGALERFRASGKPVIAYGDNFSFGGYYLASVADKIYADEFASAAHPPRQVQISRRAVHRQRHQRGQPGAEPGHGGRPLEGRRRQHLRVP